MIKQTERPLLNFARPEPSYPVLAAGAVVLICLLAGLISAVGAGSYLFAALFLLSIGGLALFLRTDVRQWKRMAVGEQNKGLAWNVDLPESQRQKLNAEVIQLAKILDISQEQLSDLLSAYIVAEDLALRQIQQEAGVPVMRHVSLGNTPFDGVLVKQDLVTCVEVTFLVTPEVSQEKINLTLNKMASTQKAFENLKIDAKTRLLLVLVTQLDHEGEARLRSSLVKKFGRTPVDVDIRLLDFENLQKIYAMD
jgi:hypothetical protein